MTDQINCKKSIALVMAGLIANVSAASINGMNSNANKNAFMKSNNGQVNTQAIYSAASQQARNFGQQKKIEMQSQMNSKMLSGNTQASMVLTAPTSSIKKITGIQAGTASYHSNSNLRNTGSFGNNAFSQFSNYNQAPNTASNYGLSGQNGTYRPQQQQYQVSNTLKSSSAGNYRSQSAGYGQIASNYQAPQKAQQGQQGLRTQSTSQVQAYLQKNASSSSASTLKSTKAA
jgi:hypothetical protein